MLINNAQRLNVWLGLNDKFSYEEMCAASTAQGVQLLTAMVFAAKVGMMMVAKSEFPEMEYKDAVMAFAAKYNGQEIFYPASEIKNEQVPSPENKGRGCCGDNGVPSQSRGLGDTVFKITHATGLDKLAEIYTKITGQPCGCAERQEALNKLFTYGIREE